MATVNFIPCSKQCVSSMKAEIEYVLQDFKVCINREKLDTDHTINYQTYTPDADKSNSIRLISGKNCCPDTAFAEFMATKNSFKKADEVMFYHYDQSFKDGETISPKTAHEIAVKFAEDNYPDFEVVIATHVDNEHLHSHFIINSVSFKTGKKLHEPPNTLLKLRAYSDKICKQYGLTTLEPYLGGKSRSLGSREYRAAAKGESWKFALMVAIDDCMKRAPTKKVFVELMERKGYAVKWTNTRKSITYTCPNNKACRDILLHNPRYLKEKMEREFELRRIETEERQLAARESIAGAATTAAELLSAADRGMEMDMQRDPQSAPTGEQPTGEFQTGTSLGQSTPDQGGFTGDTASNQDDGTDAITGWEAERETFFNPEAPITHLGMDTAMDSPALDLAGIGSNLVQLGRAVEQFDSPVPIKDATTVPQPKGKHRKLAVGQKEDDHSGYDFQMKM